MTNEEAIKVLNMVEAHGLADEAKKMAIASLEAQDTRHITLSIDEKVLKKLTDKAVQDAVEEIRQEALCWDAISRQAAQLKVAKVTWEDGDSCYDFHDKCVDCLDDVPPVITKQSGWIPVSERLPEEFESVLVCYKSQGGMAQAVSERFGTYTGYRWSALAGIEPIAWMPLPEPYEGAKMQEVTGA